ncbi:MAG: HAD-IIB family hydrolase [Planctomycetota bacterium]
MTIATREPVRLYVIRHGETEWSLSGRHTGRTDIPLTAQGEHDARELGTALRSIRFAHAFTSPRLRAMRTCELVALGPPAQVDPDLAEWDYGDYEGRLTADIRVSHANWTVYRDGCPHGETPTQVLARADRLIARLRALQGNVAIFSHGQFSAALAARWIGLPIVEAEHFELGTASLAVLGHAAHHPDVPVIAQWNATAGTIAQRTDDPRNDSATSPKRTTLERWENEGGAPARERCALTKKLVVFDLDGTIAESKAAVDAEMAALLRDLLRIVEVAVISGGNWPQFQKQLVSHLPPDADLRALSLLPTCGTKFYRYTDDWDLLYAEEFTADQRAKILGALNSVMASSQIATSGQWGEVVEDRGTQITFSALGQEAPLAEKQKWDPDFAKRKRMQGLLAQLIPEFSVRVGGTTSIDVTRPGIDKAYGIRKLRDLLGISIDEMVFIGDALFPGGNDHPAREAGVVCIQVRDSHETKRLIETILACRNGAARTTRDASASMRAAASTSRAVPDSGLHSQRCDLEQAHE